MMNPGDSDSLLAALEHQNVGVLILSDSGDLHWANSAVQHITGFDLSQAGGQPLAFLPFDAGLPWQQPEVTDQSGAWQGELKCQGASGESLFVHLSLSRMPPDDTGEQRWLLLLFNLSQHLAYTDHLEQLLRIDPLTGLLNREVFRELIRNGLYRCRSSGQRLVVLFLDLDGFKSVNDVHGHAVGDQLLQKIAERLRRVVAAQVPGTEIARLGGDEFALLLAPEPDPVPNADTLCQAILAMLSEPFQVEDAPEPLPLAASIGGAVGPLGRESASDLLHRADQAMYKVKQSGGHTSFIERAHSPAAPGAPSSIDVERALREKQFEAHFQPIADLIAGTLIALEARVRWRDGPEPYLTAREVLRAASAVDAEAALDFIVIDHAIDAIQQLDTMVPRPPPVNVNLSVATCLEPDFLAQLDARLAHHAFDGNRLRLEIPVNAFKTSPSTLMALTEQLRKRHIAVAVDHVDNPDLDALQFDQVPILTIKLDEQCVESVPDDARVMAQLRAIQRAATRYGLRIGAEGIQRLEQLESLREIGCHEGQGPLIARPRPLQELNLLIRKGRCW